MTLILYALALLLALLLGHRIGLRSRVFPLMNEDQMEALAYLLKKEKLRHRLDIRRIDADLKALRKMGVYPPDTIDVNAWIETKKGKA